MISNSIFATRYAVFWLNNRIEKGSNPIHNHAIIAPPSVSSCDSRNYSMVQ